MFRRALSDVHLCFFYKQCTIYLLAKNSLQLLRNISFIFQRMKWNMRAGSFHRISHFKYFIFENIFNDIVSKPQFALNRCSGTHSFCWQEAVHPWTKNGHEYEIVQSVWVIEMQVTLLHLSFVLFFQSQKKEDFFKICFFSMGL